VTKRPVLLIACRQCGAVTRRHSKSKTLCHACTFKALRARREMPVNWRWRARQWLESGGTRLPGVL